MQNLSNRFVFLTAFLLSLLLFTSCTRKARFDQSVVVPSAHGRVKVKKDANNNYSINVYVRDLTVPERLVPAKKTYIVWNEASNGVFNIGQLVSSRSFLKRGFTAELNAVSPNNPRRVFVTAEDDANTLAPGPQVVLNSGKL